MVLQRTNFSNHKKIAVTRDLSFRKRRWNMRFAAPTHSLGPEQFRKRAWFKLLWILITLSCVCPCFYQIGLRVKEYAERPVNLEVRTTRQTNFDFPSVTLCSGISTHRIRHWVNVMECEKNNSRCSNSELQHVSKLSDKDDIMKSWVDYETKIEDISIGRPCPMFVSETRHCSPRPASELMNSEVLDTIWGRCLSLTLKNKTVPFKGPFSWISINWEFRFNISGDESLYFFVHREGEKLVHDAPFIADTIRVGYESTVSITAKEYHALHTSTNPCLSSVTQCFNDCVEKMIEKKLNCRLPFINSTRLTTCDSIRTIITAFRIADDVYDKFERNTCECPRQCVSVNYKMNTDGEQLNEQNKTKLTLLYADDVKEELIEKSAFSQSALFSEIGGSLGLYLGVSIITLIRLMESLLSRVAYRVKKN